MDDFLVIIIFFIVVGVIERVLRAAQKAKAEPPIERETRAEDEGPIEGVPASLQDLIAEELGINLERKPRVQRSPEPAPPPVPPAAVSEHPARLRPPASAHPSREPVVIHPKPRDEVPERAADRAAAVARKHREEIARRRAAEPARRRAALTRKPLREADRPLSLEERAILERGEPVTLERPRRPEDHERFHERYMEGKPPAARRSRPPLPDRGDWSAAQKAIIWAEILGPPRGLED